MHFDRLNFYHIFCFMNSKTIQNLFFLFLISTCLMSDSIADEPSHNEQNYNDPSQRKFVNDRNPSAATFDKRLPPVIPGEEISDGKDSMNVWSTSGSPTGGNVPQPPSPPGSNNNSAVGNIGVIIDGREANFGSRPSSR
jgi:hypothetical protein